jgi:CRP/FNR family transcriptional regulator
MYNPQLAPSTRDGSLPSFGLARAVATLEDLFLSQPAELFDAGQAIFWEGDPAADVFHIVEGCLRLCRNLPDGRRAVIGFAFGGEVLGVSFPGSYSYSAEAVTPVRLRRLTRRRFLAAVDGSADLRPKLLARMYEEMNAAQQHMIVLGQLGAEERVVSFLLSAARRTGADRKRPVAVDLPMSRLDIADYLGLTIETVCRAISKLKRAGLIAMEGRHTIVLRRMAELQEQAGGLDEEDEYSQAPVSVRHPAVWPN